MNRERVTFVPNACYIATDFRDSRLLRPTPEIVIRVCWACHQMVTGTAQGIGKACALRFAHEGANVVVADRAERASANPMIKFNTNFRQTNGRRVTVNKIPSHLSDPSRAGALEKEITDRENRRGRILLHAAKKTLRANGTNVTKIT